MNGLGDTYLNDSLCFNVTWHAWAGIYQHNNGMTSELIDSNDVMQAKRTNKVNFEKKVSKKLKSLRNRIVFSNECKL